MLLFIAFVSVFSIVSCRHNDIAWTGGPIHLNCEYRVDLFTLKGQYIKDNVITIKAITFKEEIYVLTPRLKPGVLATIWLVLQTSKGVELQPYPELSEHSIGNCDSLQNAVDFQLDHFGNLWILDSGIIETHYNPRCTCPPKVVVISLLQGKITRQVDLASLVEPDSVLQNIATEYTIEGKIFIYISDASRGAIIVHDVSANTGWIVVACAPAVGLQMSITKKGLTHYVLILVRVSYPGLMEMDTAALRRKESVSPIRDHIRSIDGKFYTFTVHIWSAHRYTETSRFLWSHGRTGKVDLTGHYIENLKIFNEHATSLLLLGSGSHHIFLRHTDSTDILLWDAREAFNSSRLHLLHSPVPHLMPSSVSVEPLVHTITILDTNYPESNLMNSPTYHRITFIDKILC